MKRILLIILLASAICSCRQVEYVPVETTRTDSIYLVRTERDSIYLRDSIHVRDAGDTVYVERWRWGYRDRWRTDTMYSERVDTVSVPYPVERKLSRWEETKMEVGGWAMGVLLAVVAVAVVWLVRRKVNKS